jgi:APA family basic amino acid/polyamine antiporter
MTAATDRARIGGWGATALVISHTVAVGIFLTPAGLIGGLASPAWTFGLWTIGAVAVLAGAFTFGELASRYPQAGGLYVYLREAWGPRVAFLYGWQALLVMDPGVTAALAAGASQYAGVVIPSLAAYPRATAAALIWIVAALNMAGLTFGARVFALLTIVKIGTLAAIVFGGFFVGAGSWSHFVPFVGDRVGATMPLAPAVAIGLVSVFFSFGGFWEASRIAAEVRDPRRQVPLALVAGVACVTVIYLLTTAAFVFLVPPASATSAAEFARLAGEALAGSSGPALLASAVLVSVVASSMAMLMVAPRLYEAMGRDGLFPRAIATRTATGVPVRATLVLATLATTFVLLGTFDQIVSFFIAATLVFLALAAAAVFVVRRRAGAPAPFRAPGYPATPAVFMTLVLGITIMVTANRPLQALTGGVLVLLGLPAYRIFERRRASEAKLGEVRR